MPDHKTHNKKVVIIGAGFTGLSAAYYLSQSGFNVTVLEKESGVGGLAGSFDINGTKLEKFYHHWFTNDRHIIDLIKELNAEEDILYRATNTGIYYANNFYRLSSPLDLLQFKPLRFINRLRLGLFTVMAQRIKNWHNLENLSAEEWIIKYAGDEVYNVVWKPLLSNKFGPYASAVSAVWLWNKLVLRGGSRAKSGKEVLLYFKGGFASLADKLVSAIEEHGGQVLTGEPCRAIECSGSRIKKIITNSQTIEADYVILTPALPIIAGLLKTHVPDAYIDQISRIKYLANVCLILVLDRSLSETYWLNVNDPDFPFVGLIEHTNFEPPRAYQGKHIVYLSRYLPETEPMYHMNNDQVMDLIVPHIKRMFPEFEKSWIADFYAWRELYAQPVVTRNYRETIPDNETPLENCYISSMAQIYPEDRGTNYAVRSGKQVAERVISSESRN